jgi:hypothetical protein
MQFSYFWVEIFLQDKNNTFKLKKNRRNAVSIATEYGLGDCGVKVRVPVGSRILISPYCPHRLLGPNITFYSVSTRGSFSGVKLQGREADHWPLISASTPPYAFMASI